MTDNTEVKENAELSKLTDARNEIIPSSEHVQRVHKEFYCVTRDFGNRQLADEWTPIQVISAPHFLSALKDAYESGWMARAVIAADRAQRSESSRDAVIDADVRKDWVLAPREPMHEQWQAGSLTLKSHNDTPHMESPVRKAVAIAVYKAMIAAIPTTTS